MHFHNFYIKMYMRVFCMASVLHHTSFLTTRLAFKLRGLLPYKVPQLSPPFLFFDVIADKVHIRPMDWKHITCPIYFNGCRLSLSAFRAYKVQMYFGVLRLSLHSICGTWSVLDIGFYNCSIPFASKATLLRKVY